MHCLKCTKMRVRVEKLDVLGWNKSVMRSLICVRYGRIRNAGHSQTPLNICTSWPLQLPRIYLSALKDKFGCRVNFADDFRMPDLSVHHKKSKQLQGLCKVRNVEVKCFTQMEDDIENWRELLQLRQPRHNKAKGV